MALFDLDWNTYAIRSLGINYDPIWNQKRRLDVGDKSEDPLLRPRGEARPAAQFDIWTSAKILCLDGRSSRPIFAEEGLSMNSRRHFIEDMPRRSFLELGLKGGAALAASPALIRRLLAQDIPPKPQFAAEDLNRIIRQALAKGGDFGEVYIEYRISRSILLEEAAF